MEITKLNFNEKLSEVINNITQCTFIGFDAEFSSILSDECFKYRLFDTNEERYDKMKNVVSQMIMTQVGLTLFKYEREGGAYKATTYTFHLCPQVFGDIDQSFVFQASTLKFLCRHNFDFNKFTYEGIPYLSLAEEQQIRQQLRDNSLLTNLMRSLDLEDEKLLQMHCSRVSQWVSARQQAGPDGDGDSDSDTLYLDVGAGAGAGAGAADSVLRYVLHRELRRRFPQIRTANSLGNTNMVVVYRDAGAAVAGGARCPSERELGEEVVARAAGFSAVVRALVAAAARKPLVGHNLYLDLVLLQRQFVGPLPHKYAAFKRALHAALPLLYDTKYISHLMAHQHHHHQRHHHQHEPHQLWKTNTLQHLYEFFKEEKCKRVSQLARVDIQWAWGAGGGDGATGTLAYHNAGFDSYCTAYVLARLGQWAAREARGGGAGAGGAGGADVTPCEMFAALRALPALNRVHVMRAATPYLELAGDDPVTRRPPLIYVECRDEPINVAMVAELLAGFGSVDVKPLGARAALVAAATHHTADRILARFSSERYRVCAYSPLRHSPRARHALWGGVAAAAAAGGALLLLLRGRLPAPPAPPACPPAT